MAALHGTSAKDRNDGRLIPFMCVFPKVRAAKAILLAILLIGFGYAAAAQPRPSTLAMSCNQARGFVAVRGAAVLSTGPGTYSRFVASAGACERGQVTMPAWTATADTRLCFIGDPCRDTDLETGQ